MVAMNFSEIVVGVSRDAHFLAKEARGYAESGSNGMLVLKIGGFVYVVIGLTYLINSFLMRRGLYSHF
jgi:hypothetical protein